MNPPLKWTQSGDQWHAQAGESTRYMAVPAAGVWYACIVTGTRHKRGITLSPDHGETEDDAKDRCQHHANEKP